MESKSKVWDRYANLTKSEIFRDKVRYETYLFLTKIINYFYHRRLSRYSKLKDLIVNLTKANKMSADISDCLALYEDILNIKPKYILELGSGTSTAAICLAIDKIKEKENNYSPVFVSIESRPKWFNYHKENIPKDLLCNVQLIFREEKIKILHGEEVAFYENIPIHPYEYIHVDGPDIHGLGVDLQSDLISLEKHLNDKCLIVFDGRRNTSRFSRRNMSGFNFRRHSKTLNHMISKEKINNGFFLDFLIRD